MLGPLLTFFIQRRAGPVAFALVVAALGIHAYLRTPVEAFPDVTNVQVTVIGQVQGLAAEEMERQISVPLERALNGTPGMIGMRSESQFGLSLVTLVFDDSADAFRSRVLIQERIGTHVPP